MKIKALFICIIFLIIFTRQIYSQPQPERGRMPLPFIENFDESWNSGAPSNFPYVWTKNFISNYTNWEQYDGCLNNTPGVSPAGGSNALFYIEDWSEPETMLITPAIDFGNYTVNPHLSFWHCQHEWAGDQDTLGIYYRNPTWNEGSGKYQGDWTFLTSFNYNIPDWTQTTIMLPQISERYQIGFMGYAYYGYGIGLDQVEVSGQHSGFSFDLTPGFCLDFDGDEYVEVPISLYANPINSFTVSCWLKVESFDNTTQYIIDSNTSNYGYALLASNTSFIFKISAPQNNPSIWGATPVLNEWTHLTGTYDGNAMKLYINGTLSAQATSISYLVNTYEPLIIGNNFIGKLDEIKIWNKAFTSDEIREEMYLPVSSSDSSITTYWQCIDGSGSQFSDGYGTSQGTMIGMEEEDWEISTFPFAEGSSSSQTESLGNIEFTNENVSLYFHSQNGARITTTKLDSSPNLLPDEPDTVFDQQYWIINRFGSGPFNADVTFEITENLTLDDETNPSNIKLYSRSSNSEGDWSYIADSSSIDEQSNQVTFNGITNLSQFIIARNTDILEEPQNILIEVSSETVSFNWNPVENAGSYSVYSSQDPNDNEENWILEESGITETSWSEAATGLKKFYFVKAVQE